MLGVQVQQQEQYAWQTFCAASVRVVPSEGAAAAAVAALMQGGLQGGQELYQHRLPQLADRMQHLLSEAPLVSLPAQGMFSAPQQPQFRCYSLCFVPLTPAAARNTDDAVLHGCLWAVHVPAERLYIIDC